MADDKIKISASFELTERQRNVLHAAADGLLKAAHTAGSVAKTAGEKAKAPVAGITREEQQVLEKVKRAMDSSIQGVSSLKITSEDISLVEGAVRRNAELLEKEARSVAASARSTASRAISRAKLGRAALEVALKESFHKHMPQLAKEEDSAGTIAGQMKGLYSSLKNLRDKVEIEVKFKKK